MLKRAIERLKSSRILLLTLTLLPMFAGSGRADVLFVGSGAFTTCAVGALPCHQDPEYIGSNDLSVFVNSSGGNLAMDMPVLLILGLPNFPGGLPPMISGATLYTNYVANTSNPGLSTYSTSRAIAPPTLNGTNGAPGGGLYYGGQWNTTTGAANQTLTAGTGTDVYSILHLAGADNSNNWTNWSGADHTIGVNPTSFSIFVYEMETPLATGNLMDVRFSGSGLPLGAFAIAYGCNENDTSIPCPKGVESQGTPFTRAGMTTTATGVPESGSYVLMSFGLACLGLLVRRRVAA